jgi:TolB-like protein/DNA-binding winged helix-turn-helix (wHTH) protein/Flp pilus assembly protein TadD
MSAPALPAARVLRFDLFELDLRAGELRKRGVKLRLHGQPIRLLGILLQRAGDLVTREELRSQLWPADTFVDFDHSLHNAIGRIREVLGDSAEMPRYIETLPRRGYRFIAPVEEVQAPVRIGAGNGNKVGQVVAVALPPRRRPRLLLTLCFCCLIGLAAWVAWQQFYGKSGAPHIRSIAVLPLQNLSGDAGEEYFADGMTEELITELSRIQALKVISRTSVMEYKGSKKHLPQIAHELGVDGIVEGSVIREGDQVRVTVQLLDGSNDRHLWSEEYQRPLRGVLNLQREVAQAITQQIRIELTPEQQGRLGSARAVNPEAYEAYLRGRYYLSNQFTMAQPLNMAKSYFEEAIQKDPGFALAYSGLADSYVYLMFFGQGQLPVDQGYRSAKESLRKALELDDSIGEAYDTLGILSWRFEWDWDAAEREFNRAIALAPSYSCAHEDRAMFLSFMGRRAEALAEVAKSIELDPGPSSVLAESGVYYQLRDYDRLVEVSRRGVTTNPGEWVEHNSLGVGYEATGKRLEAVSEYQKAIELSDGDQDATAALAYAYVAMGRRAEAKKILRDLEQKAKSGHASPYIIATICAGLGDKDRALELLEKAYRERSLDLSWFLNADFRIDSLRSDPRFQALRQRVGFPQ